MKNSSPAANKNSLSSDRKEPPYRRIESDLRARLRRGEWAKGSMLPSRRALAREYSVALQTVEHAIGGLLAEGLLRTEGRWGTYITGLAQPMSRELSSVQPPVATSRAPALSATLGLLDTHSLFTHAPRRDDFGWTDIIATHAERAFAHLGGSTHYFNRFGPGNECIAVSQALAGLIEEGVDALLVIGIFDEDHKMQEVIHAMENLSIPAVYICWQDIGGSVPHVFYDNRIAGGQAAQHLMRSGYSDLVYFAPFVAPWAEERLVGIRQTAGDSTRVFPVHRIPADAERSSSLFRQSAGDLIREYVQSNQSASPVGIIAAHDSLALLVMEASAEAGLTPGRDFGLVGFDDDPAARLQGLTTLFPPLEALGEHAAKMLLNRLGGDETELQIRLRSHLLPRASTRLPRS